MQVACKGLALDDLDFGRFSAWAHSTKRRQAYYSRPTFVKIPECAKKLAKQNWQSKGNLIEE